MALLLVIIYVSFISLGLPDALLGSAWPIMHTELGVPIANAGIISMIITGGTIVSSLLSDSMIKKFGTGIVTLVSVLMTAAALIGFSFSDSFILMCMLAIPLGLGAGAIDAALNNFVALHYEAKHMSWLHCFWGVGASIGPIIMSISMVQDGNWTAGYRTVGIIQFALVFILLLSLPLWKKFVSNTESQGKQPSQKLLQLLKLPKAKRILIAFFCYCAIEMTVGLWGSSYLVVVRGVSIGAAASWISLYYIGITLGRFFSGFLAIKMSNKQMILLGQSLIAAGIIVLLIGALPMLVGLFLIGLGCAPIYPSMLHETPKNFGEQNSQAIMGVQMASAYVGSTLAPPLFGLIADNSSYAIFPFFVAVLLVTMFVMLRTVSK